MRFMQAKTLADQGQYVLFGVRADAPKTVMAIFVIREIMSVVLLKNHPRRLPRQIILSG